MSLEQVNALYDSIYGSNGVDRSAADWYANSVSSGKMTLGQVESQLKATAAQKAKQFGGASLSTATTSASKPSASSQILPGSTASQDQIKAHIDRLNSAKTIQSGPAASSTPPATSGPYASQVQDLYKGLLGREAGQAGLDFYTGKLQSGVSLDQVRNEIFSSDEAQNYRYKYGQDRITQQGGTNPHANAAPATDAMVDQVANLYRQHLGRDPDQAGLNWWLQHAEQNGIAATADAFQHAQEVQGYRNPNLNPGQNDGAGTGWNSPAIPSDQIPGSWYDPETPRNGQYGQVDVATDPVVRQVNSEADTVQGQLNGLLQRQNPLMQRAYYRGLDMANSRGLLNSSMASEAAQAAMMDAALPIAQQDAQTYYDQGARNQATMNEFNLNERQIQHDMEMQDSELGSQMAIERLKQNSGLYAQFIQGMSDINAADMDQGAKDTAMLELWRVINSGTALATSLTNVRFEDGRMVYDEIPEGETGLLQDMSGGVTPPEVPQSNVSSQTWGDGGIYTPGFTRNTRGEVVDANGNPAPADNRPDYQKAISALNSNRIDRYDLIDGKWVKKRSTVVEQGA